jgi:hypothetical protein
MKMDLWYESYIDLTQPQHNAALRSLINALMKSVGEHGEFRIELGGALHYGTYTVTGPGKGPGHSAQKAIAKESKHGEPTGHPRQYRCWEVLNAPQPVTTAYS